MEITTWIDLTSLAIGGLSVLLSFSRGFFRECLTILVWVLSALGSLTFGPSLVPLMLEVPTLADFFLDNCPLTMLVAFVASFVISLMILSLLAKLLLPLNAVTGNTGSLWKGIDQTAGIFFGFLRAIIILVFLLITIQDFLPDVYLPKGFDKALDKSVTNKLLAPSKTIISQELIGKSSIFLKGTYKFIMTNNCESY